MLPWAPPELSKARSSMSWPTHIVDDYTGHLFMLSPTQEPDHSRLLNHLELENQSRMALQQHEASSR
jgi:hypothetical protein